MTTSISGSSSLPSPLYYPFENDSTIDEYNYQERLTALNYLTLSNEQKALLAKKIDINLLFSHEFQDHLIYMQQEDPQAVQELLSTTLRWLLNNFSLSILVKKFESFKDKKTYSLLAELCITDESLLSPLTAVLNLTATEGLQEQCNLLKSIASARTHIHTLLKADPHNTSLTILHDALTSYYDQERRGLRFSRLGHDIHDLPTICLLSHLCSTEQIFFPFHLADHLTDLIEEHFPDTFEKLQSLRLNQPPLSLRL